MLGVYYVQWSRKYWEKAVWRIRLQELRKPTETFNKWFPNTEAGVTFRVTKQSFSHGGMQVILATN